MADQWYHVTLLLKRAFSKRNPSSSFLVVSCHAACHCNPEGTAGSPEDCHPSTGQCLCLDHVSGRDCTYCQMGYFNLKPGVGCER